MRFLENDLETILFKASKTKKGRSYVANRGGPLIHRPLHQQVKIGQYGRCDLLDVHYDPWYIHTNVFELKKTAIKNDAVVQLFRYIKGMQSFIKNTPRFNNLNHWVEGILIGRTIDVDSEFVKMMHYSEPLISLYTYQYDMDGIRFKQLYKPFDDLNCEVPESKKLRKIIVNPLTKYLKGAEKHFKESILIQN